MTVLMLAFGIAIAGGGGDFCSVVDVDAVAAEWSDGGDVTVSEAPDGTDVIVEWRAYDGWGDISWSSRSSVGSTESAFGDSFSEAASLLDLSDP